MRGRSFLFVLLFNLLNVNVFAQEPAIASYFLGIGGGGTPYNSQAVLELNIKLFEAQFQKTKAAAERIQIHFGAGSKQGSCDVIQKVENGLDNVESLFSDLFDADREPDCIIRPNSLENVSGPATKIDVLNRMNEFAQEIKSPAKLRIYFTGHGGAGHSNSDKNDYRKNTLHMWEQDDINVNEFVSALDNLRPDTQTQVVMVQCYSGGFAQMNFRGGDVESGVSSAARCGFFSQVRDRTAAGCTPDLKIREEYSPYFFAAVSGKNEKGELVSADFNGDGKVGSDEAHAYVIMNENAADVPVSTSSEFLRETVIAIPAKLKSQPWRFFEERLDPLEKQIVSSLSKTLKIDLSATSAPYLFLKTMIGRLTSKVAKAEILNNQSFQLYSDVRGMILVDLQTKFPIFKTAYGVDRGNLRNPDSDLVAKAKLAFENHSLFSTLTENQMVSQRTARQLSNLSHLSAKWERLFYLLHSILAEEVLSRSESTKLKSRYAELKACEADTFF